MPKRRTAVQYLAASAIALGIAIMFWSYFSAQPQMPAQDPAVQGISLQTPASTPSPSASPGASGSSGASSSPGSTEPSVGPSVGPASKSPPLAVYLRRPHYANKVGTITLPSLHLSWPIFEGTTAKLLARGVGHFRQSVLPGEGDNSVVSGHRATVFNRLGELHKGDQIFVKTSAGTFTYRVRSFRIVKRTNRTVIVSSKTPVLTLTTCWPFNHFGTTTQAFIVSADLVASRLASK